MTKLSPSGAMSDVRLVHRASNVKTRHSVVLTGFATDEADCGANGEGRGGDEGGDMAHNNEG